MTCISQNFSSVPAVVPSYKSCPAALPLLVVVTKKCIFPPLCELCTFTLSQQNFTEKTFDQNHVVAIVLGLEIKAFSKESVVALPLHIISNIVFESFCSYLIFYCSKVKSGVPIFLSLF